MYKKDRRLQVSFPLSVLLILTITACEGTSSDTADGDLETSQIPAAPVDDPDAVQTEEMTGMALALSVEGVLVVDQQSGTTRTIPFETDIETSQTAISASLGEPGAGPMSFVTWAYGFTI